jgi:hypothetical protein
MLETAPAVKSGFEVHLSIAASGSRRLPDTGLWVGDPGAAASEAIAAIRPAFVAFDVASDAAALDRIDAWLEVAEQTEIGLVARIPAAGRSPELLPIVERLARSRRVRMIVLVDRGEQLPTARASTPARDRAIQVRKQLEVAIGTRGHFADLNRAWLRVRGFGSVAFPLDPLTHADDELSIVESLEALPAMIATAQRRRRGLRAHVMPVASGTDRATEWESFGAAWTAASVLALGWAGASSVAYEGVLPVPEPRSRDARSGIGTTAVPPARQESPGRLALEVVGDLRSPRLARVAGSEDRPVLAAGLESAGVRGVLVTNLSAAPAVVSIGPLRGLWKRLTTPDEVRIADPAAGSRTIAARSLRSRANAIEFELGGHGVALVKSAVRG